MCMHIINDDISELHVILGLELGIHLGIIRNFTYFYCKSNITHNRGLGCDYNLLGAYFEV
jgi:hypothetical protein